jgi:hypothetical protein
MMIRSISIVGLFLESPGWRTTAFNYVAARQQRAGPAPAAGRDQDHSRIPRPPVTDWSRRMAWGDFSVGDAIPSMSFPLSMHRLIVQAGANQDFASIHHNSESHPGRR